MKSIFKIRIWVAAIILLCLGGSKAYAQMQQSDSTVWIALDTLRIVYIYADTGKALNRTDKMGRKQGLWEQKYPNGNIRYRGDFKDDKPYGVFKYYYEDNDSLRILSIYSDNGRVARVHEYYPSGVLASTGKYIDQKKDSVWKIYDEIQNLRYKQQYVNGELNGKSVVFYVDGNVLETKVWKNDLEDGKWEQFYDDGTLKQEATYVNGKLEGPANFYSEEGKLMISGAYKNDMKNGNWLDYDDNGVIRDSIRFINGRPADPKRFIIQQQQFDSLRNQQLPDPGGENPPKGVPKDDDGEEY